ncbi:MAG: hypothetical protein QOK04_1712, partial [Solirubrobacteraceae bacterium]|nr:hypothetical protein [Solirubrobacteraceae bacterium]
MSPVGPVSATVSLGAGLARDLRVVPDLAFVPDDRAAGI